MKKENINRVLIIRFSSLGDVLLASPLIRVLREKYPEAAIDFLVRKEYADLVRYNPNLSEVIDFDINNGAPGLKKLAADLAKTGCDVVLDIHRSLRSLYLISHLKVYSIFNSVLRFLHLGGSKFSSRNPKIYFIRKNYLARFLLVNWKINLYTIARREFLPVWKKYLRTARALGVQPDNRGIDLNLPEDAEISIGGHLQSLPAGDWKVAMAPGAKHFTKRWLPEYYADLIQMLFKKYKIRTILVGGEDDIETANEIKTLVPAEILFSLVGKLSIPETAAVIKNAALVVSNDSGLMHVATAFQRPLVAIFGSTVKELGFFPIGNKSIVVENKGLYCRPCSHIGKSSCPEHHFRCMKEVTPEMVLEIIRREKIFPSSK